MRNNESSEGQFQSENIDSWLQRIKFFENSIIVSTITYEHIPIKLDIKYSITIVDLTKIFEPLKSIKPAILTNIDFYTFFNRFFLIELSQFAQSQNILNLDEKIQKQRNLFMTNLNIEFTPFGLELDSLIIKTFTTIKDPNSVKEKDISGWILYPLILLAFGSAIYFSFFV